MKILLDTNIILDHILSREPHVKAVGRIFELICQDRIEATITANSITDIYYIVSKRLGDIVAREALRNLFIILAIISVDGNDCISALNLPMSDFEDAVVTVCANKDNIDYIVSNDKKFLQVDSKLVHIISPEKLLALIELQQSTT